jgi:1-acyl-sn-glycerol-3-phosphate acyltransferase
MKTAPNALIVPVVVENSWKVVQYGAFPLSFGERLKWTVLAPIDTQGKNAEEITREAEHAIRTALWQ